MSIIHINQIGKKIREQFEEFLDLEDIPDKDNDRDNKILTRCLAAYAVYYKSECTLEEAASSVVDGGDDNGIDAIYYNPTQKKLVIVQSKWSNKGSGEPDSAGVSKFCVGIKDLFNIEFDRFNTKIGQKRTIIEEAINEFDTKYELVFIDTHTTLDLGIHSMRHINDLVNEMNNTGDDSQEQIITFSRLNQSVVFKSLAKRASDKPIDIELGLSQWGMVSEPYKAFYGMVSGEEVASWWENDGTRLFEKNIRQVLGDTDVNEEMDLTLHKKPESFWYFNNGITVVCDTIEKSKLGGSSRDLGSFKLTNVSIVNGAQTVSTIGKYSSSNGINTLDKVKIYIRIISLKDTPEDFGEEVTKTNNRQNRIENRDFVSQDPEQQRIKTELAIDNIDYSIMRSEAFKVTDKAFTLLEATVALACAKNKTSLSVQAKRGVGKFFENLDKGIYKEIFNVSVMGIYVYNCVRVNRIINSVLEEEIKKLSKRSGKNYGLLVHGNRIISQLTFKQLNLSSKLNTIEYVPNEDTIKIDTLAVVKNIKKQLNIHYSDSILGTLFKNSTKCNYIVNEISR